LPKAIALLSGGLDSTLAVLVMKRLGVQVTAVTFLTHFGCEISDSSSCSKNPFPAAEKYGFTVKLSHLADKFIDIVKNPRYGHGKNMNPCIDCRILMLTEARELMELTGADFIVTGEVLGQRPMSQRRESFPMIDREAGTEGLVLRPLCAKLLQPTYAELKGLVNREKLYAFCGRTRRPQMALAEEFGLSDYPNPAGGCLLTEPNYAWRLKELLTYTPEPSVRDLHLLRVGRHFRLSPEIKLIIGRDEAENDTLEKTSGAEDFYFLKAEDCGSPLALLPEGAGADLLNEAAALCARFSDNKHLPAVDVRITGAGRPSFTLNVPPASEESVRKYRILKPEKSKKPARKD
jgi:tRNA U34 2-thiouridine synthase MnmA/TrmU